MEQTIVNKKFQTIYEGTRKVDQKELRGICIAEELVDGTRPKKDLNLQVFIHEVGHILCLEHPIHTTNTVEDDNDPINAMHPRETGTNILDFQCKIIMKNCSGYLKDDP